MIIKRLRLLRSVIRMEKFFSFGEGHSVVCYRTRPPIEAEMCLRHPQMGLFGTASAGGPIFRLWQISAGMRFIMLRRNNLPCGW